MTKLTPPLTKTLFTLAVAGPILLTLEGIGSMAGATGYQWAELACKVLGAGVTTAVALLGYRNQPPPPPVTP